MKTHTKKQTYSYKNVTIEDENGTDTFRIRKSVFLAQLASHLRHISTTVVPVKVLA